MAVWVLLVFQPSSADLLPTIEDTSISLYFLVSRGVVLYALVMWYMFMYFMALSSCSSIGTHECFTTQAKLVEQNEVKEHPIVRPSAPSIIPEANIYPSLDEYEYGLGDFSEVVLRSGQE